MKLKENRLRGGYQKRKASQNLRDNLTDIYQPSIGNSKEELLHK